ncbi:hypothetical protein FB451DRAFT_1165158 [Mycena latifolia]|nr:hypothetical protein FB451DRAFT_1165158 [Mycena latifolia]
MSSISETSLSLITSTPTTSAMAKIFVTALILSSTAYILHCASPMRLTRVLVTAIAAAERAYLEAVEDAMITKYDVHIAATLTRLQLKVSELREETLRNSLSYRVSFCEFFKGRTFTVLRSIQDVRRLETHIEILKEGRLRDSDPDLPSPETMARTVSIRQRHTSFARMTSFCELLTVAPRSLVAVVALELLYRFVQCIYVKWYTCN